MGFTSSIIRTWSDSAGQVSYTKQVATDSRGGEFSGVIPAGSVDLHLEVAITLAQLKGLLIGSDQDLTIEVNHPGGASGAADQTIALEANSPVLWESGDDAACPLDVDVVDLYVTNAGATDAQLEIRAPQDATP
jgi:hypothetical protein